MIRISEAIRRQIERHGEQTYPEECCGVLLGFIHQDDSRRIEEIIEIDNRQADNRRRRFFITPEQYRQAEQAALDRHMDLLGFYHSHPDHPAIPSTFDRDHALPWFDYIIVSVQNGRAAAMAAWQLSEDRSRFLQREIVIEASSLRSDRPENSFSPVQAFGEKKP